MESPKATPLFRPMLIRYLSLINKQFVFNYEIIFKLGDRVAEKSNASKQPTLAR